MNNKKKIVAFVPIKLNSQRLHNKNILPLMNRPMCWHIFDNLCKVKEIDKICVYCSDKKIKEYIPSDVNFIERNKKLDEDFVKGFEIYEAFINDVDADMYILAHATSPFLKADTLELALNKVISGEYDSAFSVKKFQTFAWYKNKPINYNLLDVPRTQDMGPIYIETSGFYMFNKEIFTKHRRRIGFKAYMQEVCDVEAIDIDTKDDYEFATLIAKYKEGI